MPSVNVVNTVPIKRTPRVKQLEGIFDLPPSSQSETACQFDMPFEDRDWTIGLIVGPSGCGKTTVARELFGRSLVRSFRWPRDRSLVDAFPSDMGIKEITGLLSSVGFSSPPSWLRPHRVLSNGEQFRATIARAIAENRELVAIDEFTSVVDRTVARISSAAVAKTIRRRRDEQIGGRFVAVTCHYDVADWLDPDWVFDPSSGEFRWKKKEGAVLPSSSISPDAGRPPGGFSHTITI